MKNIEFHEIIECSKWVHHDNCTLDIPKAEKELREALMEAGAMRAFQWLENNGYKIIRA